MSRPWKDQKVFGIGLSKTGTTSLTKALGILGISTIHFPHDEQTFAELQRGDYRLSILREYQGATDTPIAPFFPQLDKAWPGSKFILTVRERGSWLRSVETHWTTVLDPRRARDKEFREFVDFISACVYGCISFNSERFSYVYDRHVKNVRAYFTDRPNDLVEIDICGGSGGWDELCRFLGTSVPNDVPFPHAYRSNEWTHNLVDASRELAAVVPEGETLIVIDEEALTAEFGSGRKRVPFLERGGQYAGRPADDTEAIGELERLQSEGGAHSLVVAWPAFWWLDHYQGFAAHLRNTYRCTLENDRIIVFDLGSRRA